MLTVLLVVKGVDRGDDIADELERRGHDVLLCPGPQPPGFTCPGARGDRCALAADADAVVLDGWLASEQDRKGVPYWHLALYYHSLGLPVVVLVGSEALPGHPPDDRLVSLTREAPAADVADAVDELMARGKQGVGPPGLEPGTNRL